MTGGEGRKFTDLRVETLCECVFQGKESRDFLRWIIGSGNLNPFAKEELLPVTLINGTVVLACCYLCRKPPTLIRQRINQSCSLTWVKGIYTVTFFFLQQLRLFFTSSFCFPSLCSAWSATHFLTEEEKERTLIWPVLKWSTGSSFV